MMIATMAVLIAVPTAAEEYTYSMKRGSVFEAFEALQDGLPDALAQELYGISLNHAADTVENLRDKLDIFAWIRRIVSIAEESLPSVLPMLTRMLSLLLLMAASQGIAAPSLKTCYLEVAVLFAALEVFQLTVNMVDIVQKYLTNLCSVMNSFLPIMEAVCLMGGQVTEKAVSSGGILLLLTLIGNFNRIVLVPLTSLLLTLSVVTTTCHEVKLGGLVTGLRKLLQRLWSIMGIVFSFMLGIQTILARAADSLASRTARFAIGSFIPVAGGLLSEAFSTLQTGMRFVRQAAGCGGIIVLLALLLPGVVPLVLYKAVLSLSAAVADLLDLSAVAGLLSEVGGMMDFLLGVVLVTALLFLFALILFMKAQTG